MGKGRSCPEGPVTPTGTLMPWSRLEQGSQHPAPLPALRSRCWEHHGMTIILGHSDGKVEKDISSLVRGGVGQVTRKKSLTPQKGLEGAPTKGGCFQVRVWALPSPIWKRQLIKSYTHFP